MITTKPEWMTRGACRDHDPDLHFPTGESAGYGRQIAKAKTVCAGCPVLSQCREYGMTEPHGIWGGLTEGDRRAIRAQEARQNAELQRHELLPVAELPDERPSMQEARRLLVEVLATLQARGAFEVRVSDVPPAFLDRVRSRTWVTAELARLAESGALIPSRPGVYAFPVERIEVAA